MLGRREIIKTVALSVGAACVDIPNAFAMSVSSKNLKIGHTCITWRTFSPKPGTHDDELNLTLKDISAEGYWKFETFLQVIEDWDQRGMLASLIAQYKVSLLSAYTMVDVLDPSQRKEEIARLTSQFRVFKKYNGSYIVLQVNHIDSATYNCQEHRAEIIAGLNDYAAAITDLGLQTGLHQNTSTAVESRDEVCTVMDAANTKKLTFAPDIGQLQKGGADPVQVIMDFLPILTHMHLKDYKGWRYYGGYCSFGTGMVDIAAILKMVESKGLHTGVMVELDPGGSMTPLETATISEIYFERLGFKFRI